MNRYVPFSQKDSFRYWFNVNCIKCQNYEAESKNINEAKCKAGFDMYVGTKLNVIRYQTAVFVGYHNLIGEQVILRTDCAKIKLK